MRITALLRVTFFTAYIELHTYTVYMCFVLNTLRYTWLSRLIRFLLCFVKSPKVCRLCPLPSGYAETSIPFPLNTPPPPLPPPPPNEAFCVWPSRLRFLLLFFLFYSIFSVEKKKRAIPILVETAIRSTINRYRFRFRTSSKPNQIRQ